MYGGHVTDGFDRRLVMAYLEEYLKPELLDGFVIFSTPEKPFATPSNSFNNKQAAEYVQEAFPQESPIAYGLHPNAEINFRKAQAEEMFQSIVELQPRSAAGMGGMTVQDRAQAQLDEIMERLPDQFVMADILERIEGDRSPYVNVFLQEIERMIDLTTEMRRSLLELGLGLKGDLQMTDVMETLMIALADNRVPAKWEAMAYPSRRPLNSWLNNLLERCKQLDTWTGELGLPKVTWISGLFSPQSFLTAVKQTTARAKEWPLDKTENQTDITRYWEPSQVPGINKEGAYVTGLIMEGARWDEKLSSIEESRPKDQFSKMPIILVKAVQADKVETNVYSCPVYKTEDRGPTFVFEAKIKTKHKEGKWIMAGVALLMDVVG
jgi:dynein heavy chain